MQYADLQRKFGKPLLEKTTGEVRKAFFYDAEAIVPRAYIYVENARTGVSFSFDPPRHLIAEAFRNPYAYAKAELQGIANPARLNPAELQEAA